VIGGGASGGGSKRLGLKVGRGCEGGQVYGARNLRGDSRKLLGVNVGPRPVSKSLRRKDTCARKAKNTEGRGPGGSSL